MKTKVNEVVERVFGTLSAEDLDLVDRFIRDLGVSQTVIDHITQLHYRLAVAAVIEEVRALEVGARSLKLSDRNRYKALLESQ